MITQPGALILPVAAAYLTYTCSTQCECFVSMANPVNTCDRDLRIHTNRTNKTCSWPFYRVQCACQHIHKDIGLGDIDMWKCALNEYLSFSAIKACVLSCRH